jgi:hypothetical protein
VELYLHSFIYFNGLHGNNFTFSFSVWPIFPLELYFFLFYGVENVFLVSELHCLFASYLLERDIVDTSRLSIVTVFY